MRTEQNFQNNEAKNENKENEQNKNEKKNKKKLKSTCNCRKNTKCPMDGKCLESGIVYQATVTREGMGKTETYVGLTATTFKQRYANHKHHKHTFTNKELSGA